MSFPYRLFSLLRFYAIVVFLNFVIEYFQYAQVSHALFAQILILNLFNQPLLLSHQPLTRSLSYLILCNQTLILSNQPLARMNLASTNLKRVNKTILIDRFSMQNIVIQKAQYLSAIRTLFQL